MLPFTYHLYTKLEDEKKLVFYSAVSQLHSVQGVISLAIGNDVDVIMILQFKYTINANQ